MILDMINKKIFNKLKSEYQNYSQERHNLIKLSSDILRQSKQAIFAVHKNDLPTAQALISDAEKVLKKISDQKSKKDRRLENEGAYQAALEEYSEAKLFYQFITDKKIGEIAGVGVDQYLGGLCDFTGELVRRAINLAVKKQYAEIEKYHTIVEAIIGELIQFDLTKNLRTKYDQAKRNLKNIEEILYDIAIRDKK